MNYVGSIDQGTTSTRFIIWDRTGRAVACEQREHAQILPKPGHVEHDADQIWQRTQEVIARALASAGLSGCDLAAVGITNQRETTVAWDAVTGRALHNALVWQDTRTQAIIDALDADAVDMLRRRTGLRAATYFSGSKMKVRRSRWQCAQLAATTPTLSLTRCCASGCSSSPTSPQRSARDG